MNHVIFKVGKYIYTVYACLIFILTFIIHFIPFFTIALLGKKVDKILFYLLKIWATVFFFLVGIIVRVSGKQHIKKGQQYVIIANHWSFLDTPMIYASLPIYLKTLARADFASIPLFGLIYKRMTILVDRANDTSKQKSMKRMMRLMENEKVSIFVFPEGSFNETDQLIKDFYSGAFRLAQAAQVPILPVLFPDTVKRWSYKGFWEWTPGINRAMILEPIELHTIQNSTIDELKEIAKEQMEYAFVQSEM